jgi:DNA-binding transcriptional ArsR family regulator
MTGRPSSAIRECQALADSLAPVLRALANRDRLLVVLWLGGTSSTVRQLEKVTGLRQSLVSYHLAALRASGLVVAEAEGRSNRYRLANPHLDKLAEMLGVLCPMPSQGRARVSRRNRPDAPAHRP